MKSRQQSYIKIKVKAVKYSARNISKNLYLQHENKLFRYNNTTPSDGSAKFKFYRCLSYYTNHHITKSMNCSCLMRISADLSFNEGDMIDAEILGEHSNNCSGSGKIEINESSLTKLMANKKKIEGMINYSLVSKVDLYIEDLILTNNNTSLGKIYEMCVEHFKEIGLDKTYIPSKEHIGYISERIKKNLGHNMIDYMLSNKETIENTPYLRRQFYGQILNSKNSYFIYLTQSGFRHGK